MDKSILIKDIKTYRKQLDDILQNVDKTFYTNKIPSKSPLVVHAKITEAIMWLGICLKELKEIYPESMNLENDIIEPTADNLKL